MLTLYEKRITRQLVQIKSNDNTFTVFYMWLKSNEQQDATKYIGKE